MKSFNLLKILNLSETDKEIIKLILKVKIMRYLMFKIKGDKGLGVKMTIYKKFPMMKVIMRVKEKTEAGLLK